ncbi:MAG: hypothetical protein GF350_13970, partial [Chitinivibrionales bacterium]|nr:hypothetical protein [Chitinivibrionales bacterium]
MEYSTSRDGAIRVIKPAGNIRAKNIAGLREAFDELAQEKSCQAAIDCTNVSF